jgi:hypothetical protein
VRQIDPMNMKKTGMKRVHARMLQVWDRGCKYAWFPSSSHAPKCSKRLCRLYLTGAVAHSQPTGLTAHLARGV